MGCSPSAIKPTKRTKKSRIAKHCTSQARPPVKGHSDCSEDKVFTSHNRARPRGILGIDQIKSPAQHSAESLDVFPSPFEIGTVLQASKKDVAVFIDAKDIVHPRTLALGADPVQVSRGLFR
jgi:hypothetical protein